MPQGERTYFCQVDEIERLRTVKGLNLQRLATKASVDIKTLKRAIRGEGVYLSTIERLALALGTTCDLLLRRPIERKGDELATQTEFRLNILVNGSNISYVLHQR